MTSNLRLRLSTDARLDLRDILRYTMEQWGHVQRDTYRGRLRHGMKELTRFPHLGTARDDIGEGVRVLIVAEHCIYYRLEVDAIRIHRVINARMNPPSGI